MNINNLALTETDYFRIIHLKTSVLFAAACEFSSVLAHRHDLSQSCNDYGKYLGNAFQIADDVLDYTGDIEKTGKNIGDDLAAKKMTLPLIHALSHASETDRKQLKEIISSGQRDQVAQVIAILNRYNSVNYACNAAYRHADLAKTAICNLPDSSYKNILGQLPDLAVRRDS